MLERSSCIPLVRHDVSNGTDRGAEGKRETLADLGGGGNAQREGLVDGDLRTSVWGHATRCEVALVKRSSVPNLATAPIC